MSRPAFEVADVLRLHGSGFVEKRRLTSQVRKTLRDMEQCRTAVLGGHADACDGCGTLRFSYNSCRNRHCGKCQGLEREAWVLGREADLLPVVYYHVVFTIPAELNGLCLHNPRTLYNALFESAWEVLQKFAADPKWLGAKTGATMVLHTWGQNLSLHPHLHCIVPGGGLDDRGQWVKSRAGGEQFLYPVKAMSRVFRAILLKKVLLPLENGLLVLPPGEDCFAKPEDYRPWRDSLYRKPWVVYAKRPFGGPKQVIEYLGRYTHKTAISNHRLLEVSEKGVRFSYKDYKAEGQKKEMTLSGEEFLRRFTLHILPPGFRRMRHCGILSNALKASALAAARRSLSPENVAPPAPKKTRKELRAAAVKKLFGDQDPNLCPSCKTGHWVRIGLIPGQRAPPAGQMPRWTPLRQH